MKTKIIFISNFLNHHQLPFCQEIINKGNDFNFIATENLPDEQKTLGYIDMNKKYDFVITTYDNEKNISKVINLVNQADIVIIGSAPTFYVKERLKKNKLTFRYNERIFKNGFAKLFNPKCLYYYFVNNTIYRKKNFYLLTASAYAPYDFNLIRSYPKKMIKWGYFPDNIEKDLKKLVEMKKSNKKTRILWCGRLIDIKHPELIIDLAYYLKNKNYDFIIDVVGCGDLENSIFRYAKSSGVTDLINFEGSVPSQKVTYYMNRANIFIFTSDFREGWGAVLNEAMNSACAIVASHAIGSVPFLLKNNINSFIYENGNTADFLNCVDNLIKNKEKQIIFGRNAYIYLKQNYSVKVAVERLLYLYNNNMDLNLIEDGVCSRAMIISPKKMKRIYQ